MQEHHKKSKDQSRVRKYLSKNPYAIKDILRKVYGETGGPEGVNRSIVQFAYLRKIASHLDQGMVALLVGQGYIRPSNGITSQLYSVTSKGRALLNPVQKQDAKPATNSEQLTHAHPL